MNQKTLRTTVAISGIGIHSGHPTTLKLRPAPPGTGIVFIRTDLNGVSIAARPENTCSLDYATSLGKDDIVIGTIEHLLAAVYAYEIANLWIEIDGSEVPVLDGSALPFVQLIEAAGVIEQNATHPTLTVTRTLRATDGDKWIEIRPGRGLRVTCEISFDHPMIREQRISLAVTPQSFARRLSPARTFGFLKDVEALRRRGLALGGSTENCIVLDACGVVDGELRFRDEFVRHKALDVVGDLSLIGYPLDAEVVTHKSGHALNYQLVQALLADRSSWRFSHDVAVETPLDAFAVA